MSRNRGVTRVGAALTTLALAFVAAPSSPVSAADCTGTFDANGDGRPDGVVGSPGEDVGSATDAGSVTILMGSSTAGRLQSAGARQLTQESIGQKSEANDAMGSSFALADWNGDFCTDLIIGIPGEDKGRGIAVVVLSSPTGLDTTKRVVLRQGAGGAQDAAEPGDRFGASIAAGGMTVMGTTANLVVGVPGEDLLGKTDAGAAVVYSAELVGDGFAMTAAGVLVRQGAGGLSDTPEAGDAFGSVVTAGGRGFAARLAIGVPGEDIGSVVDAGAVHQTSLDATEEDGFIHQDTPSVLDSNETGDRFGSAIGWTGSCLGGFFYPALVVGVPGEKVGRVMKAGAVIVHEVDTSGSADFYVRQGAGGVADTPERNDGFGSVIATVGSTVYVGAPGEDIGAAVDAGLVTSLQYGCVNNVPDGVMGLTVSRTYSQNSTGVQDTAESGDRLGAAIGSAGDDENPIVVIGAPGESFGKKKTTGAVHAFTAVYGNPLTAPAFIHQNTAGVPDANETGDGFGGGLLNAVP